MPPLLADFIHARTANQSAKTLDTTRQMRIVWIIWLDLLVSDDRYKR